MGLGVNSPIGTTSIIALDLSPKFIKTYIKLNLQIGIFRQNLLRIFEAFLTILF